MLPPIRKTKTLPFSPDLVYAAWISSDTVIPPATAMDVDARIGGHYRLIIDTLEFKTSAEGIFSAVEPNQRVTYSWQWLDADEVTTIDVRFSAVDDGTRIDLVHDGFTDEESRANHDPGWDSYLIGLEAALDQR